MYMCNYLCSSKHNKYYECINFQIARLSGIGGTTVRECTNRILRYLITNSTATHFNWIGKGVKMAFSKLTLTSVIIGKSNRLVSFESMCIFEYYFLVIALSFA